jgi:uncharacterized protein YdeI (YjbR/CyaY-like superfamily)
MRFQTTIRAAGKTAAGLPVPEEVVAGLGSSRRPAVKVTIKNHTYRSTIARMGGEYLISVSAENREAAGVKAGEHVVVDLQLDTEPRVVAVPADLAEALEGDTTAKEFFEGLSYSNQRRFVLPIEAAKAAETRQRRVAKTVAALREGRI